MTRVIWYVSEYICPAVGWLKFGVADEYPRHQKNFIGAMFKYTNKWVY